MKWSAKHDAPDDYIRLQGGTAQAEFECSGVGGVADEGVTESERRAVGGAADGHAETAAMRPAEIHHQCLQARIENTQGHANDLMTNPRCVKAARKARTKSSA